MKSNSIVISPKNRRPGSLGYPCGEETRQALVESGLSLFGKRGYEGASTREIAAGAGTTTPALQYYFRNKEGLYNACIDRIVELFWTHMKKPISEAQKAVTARRPDADLIDAFLAIQAQLIELMLSSRFAISAGLISSYQEAGLGPRAAAEHFYEKLHAPMSNVSCGIIGRLIGRPASDSQVIARYLALHGQGIYFLNQQRSALRSLKWEGYEGRNAAMVREIVTNLTRLCLQAMVEERKERTGTKNHEKGRC